MTPEVIERIEAKLVREHPYLVARGLTPEIVEAFGLGYHPSGRGLMQNRLCIPIRNEQGELLAYAGRWVGTEATIPMGEGKYKLPAGFQKEQVIYNLHRVQGRRHLIVVEGYFSVFRLYAMRVSAVALMGHTLSAEQRKLLVRSGAQFLTIMLDGDATGRAAASPMMELLARADLLCKFAVLPDGLQPDTAPEPLLRDLLGLRSSV